MRFGGVVALCREDANGNSMDPAGVDVSRLPGSAVLFDGKTSDGDERPHLGVVDRAMVIPMEAVPGVLRQLVIGPADNITDTVVYVEWETGGGKSAQSFETFESSQWGVFSMGCSGMAWPPGSPGLKTRVVIDQVLVQPAEFAADKLQKVWRISE